MQQREVSGIKRKLHSLGKRNRSLNHRFIWPLWSRFLVLLVLALGGMVLGQRVSIHAVRSAVSSISQQDSDQFGMLSTLDSMREAIDSSYATLMNALVSKPIDITSLQTFTQTVSGVDGLLPMLSNADRSVVQSDWKTFEHDGTVLVHDASKPKQLETELPIVQQDYTNVANDIGMLVTQNNEHTLGIVKIEDAAARSIYVTSVISLVVITFLSVIVFLLVAISLRRKMRNLIESLRVISEGNLSFPIGHLVDRSEIGIIVVEIQSLIRNLRSLVVKSLSTAEQAVVRSEELQRRIANARLLAAGIGKATEELAVAANEEANEMENGRRELDVVSSSFSLVSNMVDEVATNASAVTVSSRSGIDTINSVREIISNLERTNEYTQMQLDHVDQAFRNLLLQLEDIVSIARQTKLISLNASIEAARHNQMRSGFTVIAEEVRTLSDRTNVVSEDVMNSIKELGDSVRDTAQSVAEANSLARRGQTITDETHQTFSSIVSSMNQLSGMTLQVSTSVKASTDEMSSFVDRLHHVMALVEHTSASTQEVSSTLGEQLGDFDDLNAIGELVLKMASELRDSVQAFTV